MIYRLARRHSSVTGSCHYASVECSYSRLSAPLQRKTRAMSRSVIRCVSGVKLKKSFFHFVTHNGASKKTRPFRSERNFSSHERQKRKKRWLHLEIRYHPSHPHRSTLFNNNKGLCVRVERVLIYDEPQRAASRSRTIDVKNSSTKHEMKSAYIMCQMLCRGIIWHEQRKASVEGEEKISH